MIDFILINQFILPALSCGSTLGEALALLALAMVAITSIKLTTIIINYKK
jgi:hypothetical protein